MYANEGGWHYLSSKKLSTLLKGIRSKLVGTAISTLFVLSMSGVFPVNFTLCLNNLESVKVLFSSPV